MLETQIISEKGLREVDIDNIISQVKKIKEVEYNLKDHF